MTWSYLPDEALAKEVIILQIKNKFPGLADECLKAIEELSLPNIIEQRIKQASWKKLVKVALQDKNKDDLIKDLEKSKKAKEFKSETFEIKEYFSKLNLTESRAIFKHRSKMMQFTKMNYSNDPTYRKELWQCNSCQTNIDTQSHILWCPAYAKLRENKDINNNKDLSNYLLEVLKIRTNLNLTK